MCIRAPSSSACQRRRRSACARSTSTGTAGRCRRSSTQRDSDGDPSTSTAAPAAASAPGGGGPSTPYGLPADELHRPTSKSYQRLYGFQAHLVKVRSINSCLSALSFRVTSESPSTSSNFPSILRQAQIAWNGQWYHQPPTCNSRISCLCPVVATASLKPGRAAEGLASAAERTWIAGGCTCNTRQTGHRLRSPKCTSSSPTKAREVAP